MCLGAVLLLCDQAGMALGAVTKRVCGQQCSILYCTYSTVQYSTVRVLGGPILGTQHRMGQCCCSQRCLVRRRLV
jgi:hypothetical protein